MSLVATTVAAQTTEAGTFISLRGADTVAVESFTRNAASGTIEDDLGLRGAGRVHFTATVTPDARISTMTLDAYAPGGTTPTTHGVVSISGDTVTLDHGAGQVQHFPTAAGAILWVNPSFVLVDQLARRARAMGALPVRIPIFSLSGGVTSMVTVSKLGADSLSMVVANVEIRVALDAAGHVRGAAIPSQNIVVQILPGVHNVASLEDRDDEAASANGRRPFHQFSGTSN